MLEPATNTETIIDLFDGCESSPTLSPRPMLLRTGDGWRTSHRFFEFESPLSLITCKASLGLRGNPHLHCTGTFSSVIDYLERDVERGFDTVQLLARQAAEGKALDPRGLEPKHIAASALVTLYVEGRQHLTPLDNAQFTHAHGDELKALFAVAASPESSLEDIIDNTDFRSQ